LNGQTYVPGSTARRRLAKPFLDAHLAGHAAIRESKAQRLWPRPMPSIPAFRRSALSVRFIFLAISGRGVRTFECALSSCTSSLVQGVRWAEVFFFGTDCCSGKGSRLRATPVARLTHASKRGPWLTLKTSCCYTIPVQTLPTSSETLAMLWSACCGKARARSDGRGFSCRLRTLATPGPIKDWSLTSLEES
jgi:hypothetical protein